MTPPPPSPADSLQRLGVSHVDSLVIHDLDLGYGSRDQVELYLKELAGGARALADLRSAGTIKAFQPWAVKPFSQPPPPTLLYIPLVN
jgi:aryl-alcohol dehydrogenase-like predicted oxidoreductase